MLTLIMMSSVLFYNTIIFQKGEIMKFCFLPIIYFIASFAALHYGMEAFGFSLLTLSFVTPMMAKTVMIIFGICGLLSLISMFYPCKCKYCKEKCCGK